jgi:hypothetical protein
MFHRFHKCQNVDVRVSAVRRADVVPPRWQSLICTTRVRTTVETPQFVATGGRDPVGLCLQSVATQPTGRKGGKKHAGGTGQVFDGKSEHRFDILTSQLNTSTCDAKRQPHTHLLLSFFVAAARWCSVPVPRSCQWKDASFCPPQFSRFTSFGPVETPWQVDCTLG